ncbi:MAG: hypothetical protein ACFFCZ_25725 [Promethearchaeota archaeon]
MQQVEFKGSGWLEFGMLFFAISQILGTLFNLVFRPIGDIFPSLSQIILAIGFYLFTAANRDQLRNYPKSLPVTRLLPIFLLGLGLVNLSINWFQSFVIPPFPSITSDYNIQFGSLEEFKETIEGFLLSSNSLLMSNYALLISNGVFIFASLFFDRWIRQVLLGEEIQGWPSDELSPSMIWIALVECIRLVLIIGLISIIIQVLGQFLTVEDIASLTNLRYQSYLEELELLNIVTFEIFLLSVGLRMLYFLMTLNIFRNLEFPPSNQSNAK